MLRFLVLVVVLYGLALGALWLARFALIYPFDATYHPVPDQRLTEKHLIMADGSELIFWVANAQHKKPTILYFHGNAGGLMDREQRFDRLLNRGYGIVAMGYRGASGSGGSPSETAIANDAIEMRDRLVELLGRSPRGPIIYYGESLGTGVAVQLAAKRMPDGLILEAPYTSVIDRAAERYPVFLVRLILDQIWPTFQTIPQITAPLLILHGSDDRVIPIDHGRKVFDAAKMRDKTMIEIAGGLHHDLWGAEGQTAIFRFLDRL